MAHRPFFSITIPTFNRPGDLKKAIKSFLIQDFSDFEIVVSDNSENNDSEKICSSFKDYRIKYSRNKTNIGFARNLYKVIKQASGKYIFLFGDDDLIFKSDCLNNISKILKKYAYGYLRLKVLYHKDLQYLFDFSSTEKIYLKKNSSSLTALKFLFSVSFSMISGNIFLNDPNYSIPEIEKAADPDFLMEAFWIKFIYQKAKKYGAFYDTDNIIIQKWIIHEKNLAGASRNTPGIYDVTDNKIYVEKSWDLIFTELNSWEKQLWIKEQIFLMIPLLPSFKYYSSNSNLLLFVKRMIELERSLLYQPLFYMYLAIALFMPKGLWNILRTVVQKYKIVRNPQFNSHLENLKDSLRAL
ncbi:hypothetical protein A3D78_00235 [Candidatus Gottesmanbacteria bacterium RIFCSPHIGHO2_02_FULL_39_14]|uniref:Glycosyltransferase 2-like domain-containing protein n=1 Tax=Candidatus Gottesmanbacteria bacterium RIFCSPHIGHO2_02_FULL_39_14 TaxID=1798383 RepID=A0A1F5ZW87_9BACT|nr:MAG: hypothetical protein A3D78_00235 [Candidatus Gottesmanbacteria bacterium RIFCSPHIGHO2_02_FULL_39_14]